MLCCTVCSESSTLVNMVMLLAVPLARQDGVAAAKILQIIRMRFQGITVSDSVAPARLVFHGGIIARAMAFNPASQKAPSSGTTLNSLPTAYLRLANLTWRQAHRLHRWPR